MTKKELTLLNLCQTLDDISNIDPNGCGISRTLYKAAREHIDCPLSVNAAKKLIDAVKSNSFTFILAGFVLLPSKKAETDGIVGAIFLARAMIKAFGARPVIICPQECTHAVKEIAKCIGISLYTEIGEMTGESVPLTVVTFTKNKERAPLLAKKLISKYKPSAVISIECPGANDFGVYHNLSAKNITEFEAKSDVLFEMLEKIGVTNIAIGDRGNETGMGTIGEQIKKYIPNGKTCCCGSGGGICAKTKASNIITATVSDWGCYSLIAALAYIKKDLDILHTAELEEKVLIEAAKNGLIDMSGLAIPSIDGFGLEINKTIVNLMRECIKHTM